MSSRFLTLLIFIIALIILGLEISILNLSKKSYSAAKTLIELPQNDISYVKRFSLENNNNPISFTDTLHGFGMFVSEKDGIVSRYIKNLGTWEPEIVETLKSFLKPGQRVLHLGMHIGFHDLILGKIVGETGHVYGFEPNSESRDIVKKNLVVNNLDNIVTIYPFAASDKASDGQVAPLCFEYENTGGAFVNVSNIPQSHCFDIKLTSVDSVLNEVKSIDLLFMDIEGFEVKAIEGASSLLARSPDALIITEWAPELVKRAGSDPVSFIRSYEDRGYRFFRIETDRSSGYLYSELSAEDVIANKVPTDQYYLNLVIIPKSFQIGEELKKDFKFLK